MITLHRLGHSEASLVLNADLIAHAARTRPLSAGTIIGSGTVSNKDVNDGPGLPVAEGGHGYACIAEQRTVETIIAGSASTPYLRYGDTVRIEMKDAAGHSIFGAIEQDVLPHADKALTQPVRERSLRGTESEDRVIGLCG